MMQRGHFPAGLLRRAHQESLRGLWFSRDVHPPSQAIAALLCGSKPGLGVGGQLSLLPGWKGPKIVCEEMPPLCVPRTLVTF